MNPAPSIAGLRHWLLDVEGTLVLDKSYAPVPGVSEWFLRLREAGHELRILTNNTTDTSDELAERLTRVGFPVVAGEIISGQHRVAQILHERGISDCWLLGPDALERSLGAQGISCRMLADAAEEELRDFVDDDSPVLFALVLGYLPEVDVPLLGRALILLRQPRCLFIALHVNRLYRNRDRIEPGLGAYVRALEYAAGKEALVAGKPAAELFWAGAQSLGVAPEKIIMAGDDPAADLVPARELGMRTVFVLSGKYADASVLEEIPTELRPQLIVPHLSALPLR